MSPDHRAIAGLLLFALAFMGPFASVAEPARWPCQRRCIDAAIIWNNGFALFFQRDRFWRYDIPHDKVDIGRDFPYPRPLKDWPGLPPEWSGGIDSAVNDGNGKVYFFKGREYVRLDLVTERVDDGPLSIASNWPGLPRAWSSGFDAAVNWGDGKVYFFKGREYLGYDLKTDTASDPRPIAGNWRDLPAGFANGIDAAVNWGGGKAYLFKGDQYVRYDIAENKTDTGYPRPITANWLGLLQLIDWVAGPVTSMPAQAVKVGREEEDVFLCAALVGNAIYPGKTSPKARSCQYLDGEREQSADAFAIATTALSIEWKSGASSVSADRWIPVGKSSTGLAFYLCRVQVGNAVVPGRFANQSEGCTVARQGRSQNIKDKVEIASAPTTVNPPYMVYAVKMLSPAPGSERFKDVCAAEVVNQFRDTEAAARIPQNLPDMKAMIQIAARNSCARLYKNPGEVPAYARKVETVIENSRENNADGFVSRSASSATMTLQSRMFPAPAPETPNRLLTLINHEITHTTQGTRYKYGAFTEGVADYVLLNAWERHNRKAGGDWLDGYGTTAFFLIWLEGRYPDFVYKLNGMAKGKEEVGPEAFQRITGKPIDQLWKEYQVAIVTERGLPESRLQWSGAGTVDPRPQSCELTVYWNDNFKGDWFRTTQDHQRLAGGWNDQISSIVIESGRWEFFEHDAFGGRVLKLGPGRHPRLGEDGWNDQISSFRCLVRDPALHGWPAIGCEAAVYWHDDFGGDVLRSTHDLIRLRGGWNDQISSIVVSAGVWEFFEHDAYRGQRLKLNQGRYAHLKEWNDRISSFRCIEPAPPVTASR